MWKKIKTFIPWLISIISTVFLTKFFTRKKSSGNDNSRAAIEIEDKLDRNRESARESDKKIDSINNKLGEDKTRVESIETGLSNIETEVRGSSGDSENIGDLNRENLDIIQELQKRNGQDD